MKKIKNLALGIQTLALVVGMAVPAQAAVYAWTPYTQTSGSVVSLHSYPSVSTPIPSTTSTTPAPSTPSNTTPSNTVPSSSPIYSNSSGSSVISLKNYSYQLNQTQPSTTQTTPTQTTPTQTTPTQTTPTTTPTTTTNIPAATSVSAQEQQMIDQINQERANVGLAPLTVDLRLVGVAEAKAQDMNTNGYFSHTSPTYGSPFDMMRNAGIQFYSAGENIARNISVDAAMAAFMSSDGHKANILNPGYNHVGVGIVYSSAGSFYVQEFAQE